MDYKALLIKYMKHVISKEGTDFIVNKPEGNLFSKKEWDELEKLSEEID